MCKIYILLFLFLNSLISENMLPSVQPDDSPENSNALHGRKAQYFILLYLILNCLLWYNLLKQNIGGL